MTRKTRWTDTEAAEALTWLSARWPGWRPWHVPGALPTGGPAAPRADAFCAAPLGAAQPVLHGGSPGELTHTIAEYTDDTSGRRGDPTLGDLAHPEPQLTEGR